MFYVFHGLVMKFHERVYPLLLHKCNCSKQLTATSNVYGEDS